MIILSNNSQGIPNFWYDTENRNFWKMDKNNIQKINWNKLPKRILPKAKRILVVQLFKL